MGIILKHLQGWEMPWIESNRQSKLELNYTFSFATYVLSDLESVALPSEHVKIIHRHNNLDGFPIKL